MKSWLRLPKTYKRIGKGTFWCDARFPQSILKLCRAGLDAKLYTFKREDVLRELRSRLTPASDGKPRQFVSKRCVNLISELLEYREGKRPCTRCPAV